MKSVTPRPRRVYGAVSAPQRHWWVTRISFGAWRGHRWWQPPVARRLPVLLIALRGKTVTLHVGRPELPY